jgi:CyaY protein
MTDTEFLTAAEGVLDRIEAAMDHLNDSDVVDVECRRSGNVLELEFLRNGSKIIINSQAPLQEMWVAARAGGYHYQWRAGAWVDSRNGAELFAALSERVTEQGGAPVRL